MTDDTQQPAFPIADVKRAEPGTTDEMRAFARGGVTLRDYFAAKALVGLLAAEAHPKAGGFPCAPYTKEECAQSIADSAYILADAMLRARGSK